MPKYTVIEQFHGAGRMNRVGDQIELTDEAAATLAGFVRPSDGIAMPAATTQEADLQANIADLEALVGDLSKRLESSSFEIAELTEQLGKECEAKHEYKNALTAATEEVNALKAENEQLKAASAKAAAKGK